MTGTAGTRVLQCLCVVWCVCLDVGVTDAVVLGVSSYSDELWRFSTSTQVWQLVDFTAVNEARPSARAKHTMTSVGLDLWVFGGSTLLQTSGEGCGCWSCSDCVVV